MAIKIPGLKKSRKTMNCQQDPQTGNVHCESSRQFEDGTRETLASAEFQFDAQCNTIPTNIQENEPGELDKLARKALPLLKNKCKGTRPSDY